jgi:hypothetical protein
LKRSAILCYERNEFLELSNEIYSRIRSN